jgi:DinB family protein
MTINHLMNQKWPWIEAAHGMRSQLFDILSDADLAFTPGGQNMTLGALCREMGETEYAYIQSLKTLKHLWSYGHSEADFMSSIARLKAWFQMLDDEMQVAITALSDEDVHRPIDRGGEAVTVEFQMDAYLQAVLIFLGKATIYLKAMNRPLPPFFQEYIG